MTRLRNVPAFLAMAIMLCCSVGINAQKSAELDKKVDAAMKQLLAATPAAATLAKTAKGILMFPSVKKAGFLIGGQYGEGALRERGATQGYYTTSAASFGLQAGGQKFGYAMFLMNDSALKYLKS